MSSTQLAAAVYQVFYSLIRLFFFFFEFICDSYASYLFQANKLRGFFSCVSSRKTDASSQRGSTPQSPGLPCCALHRRPAVLRVVLKEGENKGRQFYSCSLSRENKCNFFEVRRTGGAAPSEHVSGSVHQHWLYVSLVVKRDFKNKLTTPHFLCHSGPTCTFPFVTMGNAA